MNQGWVKLHRSFLEWEWFDEPNVVWLFLKCLLLANHEDKNWHGILIKRGSFITSYSSLSSKKAKVSVQMIRTALERLKSTHEITIKTTSKYTLISINNYDKYQDINTPINNQITNDQQSNNKQITTNKNDKNVKNEEKGIYISLSPNQIKKLTEEFKVDERSVRWVLDNLQTFCRSHGTTYANYFETMRAWIKKDLLSKKIVRTLPKFNPEEHVVDPEGLKRVAEMKKKFKL